MDPSLVRIVPGSAATSAHWSDLFVQSWRDHLVGALERLCVNRINVSLIVYEPVPSFAALGATPFQVREPVRIELQAYRGYESPLSPSVLPHG